MRIRHTAVLLLTTGTTCLAAAALPLMAATAEEEPGSGLGSFSLSANAPVMQVREDYATQQCSAQVAGPAGCEGVINETVSQLSNGPVGYALSSIVWPGTLGGNLGTLLIVASGGQVPAEATALNSPVRAEARTGGVNPVVTDYPGNGAPSAAHMVASATATKVSATASLGGAQSTPLGSIGESSSSTSTTLTGVKTAEAKAHSEVQDVTIAGVVHLGGVKSDAFGTTNGTTATGSGKTVVTGATIGGVPVTIDENGVTVQTQNVPLPAAATDAVNTALANAGMTIAVSKPNVVRKGASISYSAGSVVMFWQQQPGQSMSVVLGGAQISVTSVPGFSFPSVPVTPPFTGSTTGGTFVPPTTVTPPLDGGFVPGPSATGGVVPPTVGEQPTTVPAAARLPMPHGLSPWYGVLAVLGAGLVMAGLRRLPDRVLVASTSDCPLGESA